MIGTSTMKTEILSEMLTKDDHFSTFELTSWYEHTEIRTENQKFLGWVCEIFPILCTSAYKFTNV